MDEERLCSIINLYNSMDDSAKEYIGVTDIYAILEPNDIEYLNNEIIIKGKYKYKEDASIIYTKIMLKIKGNNNIEFRKDEKIVSETSIILKGKDFSKTTYYNTLLINIKLNEKINIIYNKDCSEKENKYKNVYEMHDKPHITKIENNSLKEDIIRICNELRNDIKKETKENNLKIK